jgi:ABC-type polysaccharide/polyol phosphate transport system ATPase subunit
VTTAIRVNSLTKEFEIYDKPADLALEILTRRSRHRTFRALEGITFDLARGNVLGIIGPNGAGKSTLLKIITGVLDPTSGTVEVFGRVTAILELGLGFNPEYSGRENVRLSGLLYGMTHDEIERKLGSIIEFSGLGNFVDQAVKTYSSGMHSRLAFSIATAVDPDILIIDEALAAGDSMFVHKCMRRIRQLCSGGRTVVVVSHGTGLLAQLCHRVLWLEDGRIKMDGPALAVVQAYDLAAHQGADAQSWIENVETVSHGLDVAEGRGIASAIKDENVSDGTASAATATQLFKQIATPDPCMEVGGVATGKNVFRRGPVFIDSVDMLDHEGKRTTRLITLRPFTLRVEYHCKGPPPQETLGVALAINRLDDLAPVAQWYTQFIRPDETRESYGAASFRKRAAPRGTIELRFAYAPFRQDHYILSLGLVPNVPGTWDFYEYRHLFYVFNVSDGSLSVGAPIFFEPTSVHFNSVGTELVEPWTINA